MTPLPGFTMVFTMRGLMSFNNVRWMTEPLPKDLATKGAQAMPHTLPPASTSVTLRLAIAVPERSGAPKDPASGDTSHKNRPVNELATSMAGRRRDPFSGGDRRQGSGKAATPAGEVGRPVASALGLLHRRCELLTALGRVERVSPAGPTRVAAGGFSWR